MKLTIEEKIEIIGKLFNNEISNEVAMKEFDVKIRQIYRIINNHKIYVVDTFIHKIKGKKTYNKTPDNIK